MITAEQFSQTFEQVSRDQMPVLLECWPSQPKFTQYIKQQMMPAIADTLGCSLELEYKRIDIVFRPLPGATDNDTQIVAAIEHENNFGRSASEVRKLRNLAAPLGVLITYVSAHRREQQIADFANIMAAADKSLATSGGELLLIIGPYGMSRPASLSWEYFVHRGDQFERVTL